MAYNDTTYVTEKNIKNITAIVSSVLESQLEPFIQTAEEMHIVPALGTALDAELKADIDNGTLSGNNETLVVNYIIPASAWYTYYDAVPFLNVKTTKKGLVKQSSNYSDNADIQEVKLLQQAVLDKAVFFRNRLIDYLNDNNILYPNYRADGECLATKNNSSSIFLNW